MTCLCLVLVIWGIAVVSAYEDTYRNCYEALRRGMSTSGVYSVYISGTPMSVYCDQLTDGGGWTVIMRRTDGSLDFNRNWTDYEVGFGSLNGEFWMGLLYMTMLSSEERMELRVDLKDYKNRTAYEKYSSFHLASRMFDYLLRVTGPNGTAGDSLLQDEPGQNGWAIHNGQRFSTPDVDNDKNDYENCAAIYRAGWWYNSCMLSLLTGSYGWDKENYWMSYFFWWTWHRDFLPLKEADMKLRPVSKRY